MVASGLTTARRGVIIGAVDIEVTRSGGFAGISRTATTAEDELPAELRTRLHTLLDAPPAASGSPDRFVYQLRCGDREVTVGEKALDDEGRRLMSWVLGQR